MSAPIQLSKDEYDGVKYLLERNAPGKHTDEDMAEYRRWQVGRSMGLTPGQRYERSLEAFEVEKRCNPHAWRDKNEEFSRYVQYHAAEALGLERRDISHMPGSVYTTPTLTTLSTQYANDEFIGDALVAHIPTTKQTGTYPQYGQSDRLQYPDDAFGARGYANEIQETRTWGTYLCVPRGLSNRVSAMTLVNQDAPLDEMVDMVQGLNEGRAFNRELRTAALLTTVANYGAQTFALAAANRWNSAGGGAPITDLQRLRAMLWQGRGPGSVKGFTSTTVYNVLSRHPDILQLFVFNGNSPGLATPDMLAKWFKCTDLLVGEARRDTAQEGAAAAYSYIWEPAGAFFFGMIRVASGGIRNAGFAMSVEQGDPITNVVYDPQNGHGGSYKAQVSTSEVQQVWAAPCGALITTPIT